MTEVKQLLKDAKKELARGDYEEAIDVSKQVLNIDEDNYFAYVFLGKAYSCLDSSEFGDKSKEAINAYKAAVQLMPSNLLAWKGLFLLLSNKDEVIFPSIMNFDEYFKLCGQYTDLLLEQEQSLVDLIHSIRMMRKKFPVFEEKFLMQMRPGLPMAEKLGKYLIKPKDSLESLIKLALEKEQIEVSKIVSRERLKLSANDPDYQIKIDLLAWEVYKNSEVDDYFNQLINITDDDDERSTLEVQWLNHRITVLQSMPADTKPSYFANVKLMVEDMVLVNTSCVRAWKLYFEWQDYQNLNEIDVQLALKFFKKFPNEPLAVILYSWLFSSFSKYDMSGYTIAKDNQKNDESNLTRNKKEESQAEEEDIAELSEMVEQEDSTPILLESDIFTSLIEYIPKAQTSALAHRIISQYYILSREYEAALTYIRVGTSLVAHSIKSLGSNSSNSKLAFTLDLATVYTYFDFKRNYRSALSLYDKILTVEPSNSKAKLGKGLIFIEMKNWKDANELLLEVTEEFPDNMEMMSALAWTYTKLGLYENAIDLLVTSLQKMEGTDILSIELRTLSLWRQAKTYLYMQENEDKKNPPHESDYVSVAYQLLIQSLKLHDTFSLSFSTLGDIYSHYYQDEKRAFGCYYKAFELNSSDITAAEYIIRRYTDSDNWSAAQGIAKALVKSDGAKKHLRNVSWPFRVVGVSYLERHQESESIEWFQSALQVDKKDTESWIGLGQAYMGCGRIEASIQVFEKAIELEPHNQYAQYFIAQSLSYIGEYEDSVTRLKDLTHSSPEEEVFQSTYASTLMDYALDLYGRGFLTKSVNISIEAIEIINFLFTTLKVTPHVAWLALSRALQLFISVQSKIEDLPIETLVSIFESVESVHLNEIDSIDKISIDSVLSSTTDDNISIACKFLVLSSKYAYATGTLNRSTATIKASLWHNIGVSELMFLLISKSSEYRDASIYAFKKAIKYQSNFPESWIGLGISTMEINWRVSQHCFIKATALSPRDTEVWFNLSLLCLKTNDIELAHQVLARTQSIAPQDASPWLGMALLLEKEGKANESINMFAHAYILSNGKSKVAELLYAKNILQHQVGFSKNEREIESSEELSAAAYAVDQYLKKSPNDPYALQCALLILERLHLFTNANDLATRLANILEKRFEKTQDDKELYNFAIIKSQFARIQLGLGNYESAIENSELSQGIVQEYDSEKALSAQISNNICLGLGYYFMNDFDKTLEYFQILLQLSKDSKHLVLLIATVLYDVGTEDTKTIALDELTEYISSFGNELLIMLTIAAISILEIHIDILETLLIDLKCISLDEKIKDTHQSLQFLITNIEKRLAVNTKTSELSLLQQTAFFFPNNSNSWKKLSSKISQRVASEGQNKVTAEQLSESYCGRSNLRNIQRAIFLSPWNNKALISLKDCF